MADTEPVKIRSLLAHDRAGVAQTHSSGVEVVLGTDPSLIRCHYVLGGGGTREQYRQGD